MKKIKTTNNPMNTFFPSVSIKPSTITKKEPDMNFSTILERDHIIKEITGILTSFEKEFTNVNFKKGIYIYGSPGSGKTHFVIEVLKTLNYDVIKYDAGDVRNKSLIHL